MSVNEVIIAEDVSKEYRRGSEIIVAVKNLNIKIKRGEFFVIVGPSGSGKTTLLNILSGLDKPTTGRVVLDGLDTNMIDEEQFPKIRRERVGFIFQNWNLIDGLKAIENVEAPLWPSDLSNKVIEERALSLLRLVDLIERKDHRPKELSGGEQQRVAIARALVNNPKVVFADEPTGNLDSGTGKQIIELLRELNKKEKVSIICVTHDDSIINYADRVARIKDGQVELVSKNP
ncbi:MAG: ATP-binding cassette domain-containing protein [Candidatus Lokiarchaeota archaeon]|nr:ATP-binding cassette domain-containing protein [Candidatus Lokiarchaeota archaeon]